jgi:hypothetical protein
MIYAFKDQADGYYQVDVQDGKPIPEWASSLIPCEVRPVHGETVADKLGKLDAENQLTQRNLRETVMLMAEAFKTLSQGALDLSNIPGVAKVYEVEAQAQALRAQL